MFLLRKKADHFASLDSLPCGFVQMTGKHQIGAPFSGKILRRHLDVGATVRDSVAVYDLADLDPLYADVHVPERHVARLAPGQNVRLTADASREEVMATIERIAPAVEPATGTVKVTLTVDRATRLRPGAFVRAEIITETHDNALVVPRSALVAEGRRWNVYRLASSGSEVERIEVVLGFEEGDRVEIDGIVGAGPGLEAGDRVVVVGAPALSDGASVEVVHITRLHKLQLGCARAWPGRCAVAANLDHDFIAGSVG